MNFQLIGDIDALPDEDALVLLDSIRVSFENNENLVNFTELLPALKTRLSFSLENKTSEEVVLAIIQILADYLGEAKEDDAIVVAEQIFPLLVRLPRAKVRKAVAIVISASPYRSTNKCAEDAILDVLEKGENVSRTINALMLCTDLFMYTRQLDFTRFLTVTATYSVDPIYAIAACTAIKTIYRVDKRWQKHFDALDDDLKILVENVVNGNVVSNAANPNESSISSPTSNSPRRDFFSSTNYVNESPRGSSTLWKSDHTSEKENKEDNDVSLNLSDTFSSTLENIPSDFQTTTMDLRNAETIDLTHHNSVPDDNKSKRGSLTELNDTSNSGNLGSNTEDVLSSDTLHEINASGGTSSVNIQSDDVSRSIESSPLTGIPQIIVPSPSKFSVEDLSVSGVHMSNLGRIGPEVSPRQTTIVNKETEVPVGFQVTPRSGGDVDFDDQGASSDERPRPNRSFLNHTRGNQPFTPRGTSYSLHSGGSSTNTSFHSVGSISTSSTGYPGGPGPASPVNGSSYAVRPRESGTTGSLSNNQFLTEEIGMDVEEDPSFVPYRRSSTQLNRIRSVTQERERIGLISTSPYHFSQNSPTFNPHYGSPQTSNPPLPLVTDSDRALSAFYPPDEMNSSFMSHVSVEESAHYSNHSRSQPNLNVAKNIESGSPYMGPRDQRVQSSGPPSSPGRSPLLNHSWEPDGYVSSNSLSSIGNETAVGGGAPPNLVGAGSSLNLSVSVKSRDAIDAMRARRSKSAAKVREAMDMYQLVNTGSVHTQNQAPGRVSFNSNLGNPNDLFNSFNNLAGPHPAQISENGGSMSESVRGPPLTVDVNDAGAPSQPSFARASISQLRRSLGSGRVGSGGGGFSVLSAQNSPVRPGFSHPLATNVGSPGRGGSLDTSFQSQPSFPLATSFSEASNALSGLQALSRGVPGSPRRSPLAGSLSSSVNTSAASVGVAANQMYPTDAMLGPLEPAQLPRLLAQAPAAIAAGNENWERALEATIHIRQAALYDRWAFSSNTVPTSSPAAAGAAVLSMSKVLSLLAGLSSSLRSSLSRSALLAMRTLSALPFPNDSSLDTVLSALLKRCADMNKFLAMEAEDTLATLLCHLPLNRLAIGLLPLLESSNGGVRLLAAVWTQRLLAVMDLSWRASNPAGSANAPLKSPTANASSSWTSLSKGELTRLGAGLVRAALDGKPDGRLAGSRGLRILMVRVPGFLGLVSAGTTQSQLERAFELVNSGLGADVDTSTEISNTYLSPNPSAEEDNQSSSAEIAEKDKLRIAGLGCSALDLPVEAVRSSTSTLPMRDEFVFYVLRRGPSSHSSESPRGEGEMDFSSPQGSAVLTTSPHSPAMKSHSVFYYRLSEAFPSTAATHSTASSSVGGASKTPLRSISRTRLVASANASQGRSVSAFAAPPSPRGSSHFNHCLAANVASTPKRAASPFLRKNSGGNAGSPKRAGSASRVTQASNMTGTTGTRKAGIVPISTRELDIQTPRNSTSERPASTASLTNNSSNSSALTAASGTNGSAYNKRVIGRVGTLAPNPIKNFDLMLQEKIPFSSKYSAREERDHSPRERRSGPQRAQSGHARSSSISRNSHFSTPSTSKSSEVVDMNQFATYDGSVHTQMKNLILERNPDTNTSTSGLFPSLLGSSYSEGVSSRMDGSVNLKLPAIDLGSPQNFQPKTAIDSSHSITKNASSLGYASQNSYAKRAALVNQTSPSNTSTSNYSRSPSKTPIILEPDFSSSHAANDGSSNTAHPLRSSSKSRNATAVPNFSYQTGGYAGRLEIQNVPVTKSSGFPSLSSVSSLPTIMTEMGENKNKLAGGSKPVIFPSITSSTYRSNY